MRPSTIRHITKQCCGKGQYEASIPTVADRVAQTVAAMYLEPNVEPLFHDDSYGYRPGRGPLDAVTACRERCWKTDWVLDLDLEKFFDRVPHDLIVKAVETNTDQRWVLLYVQRWLTAPMQQPDGTLAERNRGTPQGSAVSPVLANLFLHYAFDAWMAREFPTVRFERYVDDAVVHCISERQAHMLAAAIGDRMAEVGLRLHPTKTRIVYCKDGKRRGAYDHTSFTFLGFTFRARKARGRDGKNFTSFLPAISKDALTKISREVRRWQLHLRTGHTLAELARKINPIVRGWMQYYGAFYRSALYTLLGRINAYLMRWVRKKYKRLRGYKKPRRSGNASPDAIPACSPTGCGTGPPGDQDSKSPVSREAHAGILWEPGGAIPPGHPTRTPKRCWVSCVKRSSHRRGW
jgi:RNA-directed DNA polymerase